MQWFRMYAEFAYDPKTQILTEALQRRYVMALCLHCDNKLENRPDDEIALSLRVTLDEWLNTKQEFQKRGLLNDSGIPNGWEKRQYISDIKDPTSALRQKRYRDKKRNYRNAPVTSRLPDSDTDTDTDTEKKESSPPKGEPAPLKTDFQKMILIWNETVGTVCPKIQSLTDQRKRLIASRLKDSFAGDLEQWRSYCEVILATPFCTGTNDRGWRANIDWALTPKAIAKVLEGSYLVGKTEESNDERWARIGKEMENESIRY